MAVVGLALIGLSARTLTHSYDEVTAAERPKASLGVKRVADVKTADVVYEPGHSSGWHVHPGVHAVVVLSGALTVYDEGCRSRDYAAGQIYVGGREPHLARNETAGLLRLAVMYVTDSPSDAPGSAVPAPTGCEAVE